MLPTFVIGLREGLEAALIVGIIAAFLRKQGRKDLMVWVLGGVALAIAICVAAGIALDLASQALPQKQQEGLETVIGAVAVGMVTYMVVWMRRNARNLKGQLEGLASDAMHGPSSAARAMVGMAFLAVFREGLETVVFAIAIFDQKTVNTGTAAWGLFLGIALAVLLGYGIYRGGVSLNLSKFFRGTGIVLVLVAAGLVVNALHTAHEAGWLNAGQGRTVDLSWLVAPGSVRESLLTGMLGLQPFPVTIEVIGWLVYLIPVGLYVAWPPGRSLPLRSTALTAGAVAVAAAVTAVLCGALAPGAPTQRPTFAATTSAGAVTAVVDSRGPQGAVVRTTTVQAVSGSVGAPRAYRLTSGGDAEHFGRPAEKFTTTVSGADSSGRPGTLSVAQISTLNGGRLPLGVHSTDGQITATYRDTSTLTVWLDTRTDRVLDLSWRQSVAATLHSGSNVIPLDAPIAAGTVALPAAARTSAADAATSAHDTLDERSALHGLVAWMVALAIVAALVALTCVILLRRRPAASSAAAVRAPTLARTTS